jgi:hypothetical protein
MLTIIAFLWDANGWTGGEPAPEPLDPPVSSSDAGDYVFEEEE